jgi:hypothetical protein
LATASRPTLEATHPPIKNITWIPFHGVKRPPNDADEGRGPPVQITGTRRSERGTGGPTMLRMFLFSSTVDITICRLNKLIFHPPAQVRPQLKNQILPIWCKYPPLQGGGIFTPGGRTQPWRTLAATHFHPVPR